MLLSVFDNKIDKQRSNFIFLIVTIKNINFLIFDMSLQSLDNKIADAFDFLIDVDCKGDIMFLFIFIFEFFNW